MSMCGSTGGCGDDLCEPTCPKCGEAGWDTLNPQPPSYNVDCLYCGWEGEQEELVYRHLNVPGQRKDTAPVRPMTPYVLQQLWIDAEDQARKTRTLWRYMTEDDIGGFTHR